jgi:hypothetical protein
MPSWLESRAVATSEWLHGDKALHVYARTPDRARNLERLADSAWPKFRSDVAATPAVQLVGFDLPSTIYHGGDTIYLGTYWSIDNAAGDGTKNLQLAIADNRGNALPWSVKDMILDRATQGTSLIREEQIIQIPFEVPSGLYALGLLNQDNKMTPLAEFEIRQRNRPFLTLADVDISTPREIEFENGIRLLGYEIEGDMLSPGDELDLILYWQTPQPVTRNYKVFAHVLGETYHAESENFIWTQQDNEPVNNKRPTTTWRDGEVIVDPYEMTLPANTPAGTYVLEIGLYETIGGQRLLTLGDDSSPAADHIVLEEINVR